MLLRSIVFIALICYNVSCFCIYNLSKDATFAIRQLSENTSSNIFSRFKRAALQKGENACCPYTETDCVRDMKRGTIVNINIQRIINGREYPNFTVSVPAGGWVELGGFGIEHSVLHVFHADGTPFDFEFRTGVEGDRFTKR
ncbi:hypothetical protein K501DRAFT_245939, partial [Backusella circina FSU 941]